MNPVRFKRVRASSNGPRRAMTRRVGRSFTAFMASWRGTLRFKRRHHEGNQAPEGPIRTSGSAPNRAAQRCHYFMNKPHCKQALADWPIRMFLAVLATAALNVQAGVVFTNLHNFGVFTSGASPSAGLVQGADGNFYGTTSGGGMNDFGTVFKINATGSFTSLYSFTGGNDGGEPFAALALGADGNFYGTARFGGTNGGYGTIFKINASGMFTSLHSFNAEVWNPSALVQGADGNFYGTTSGDGGTTYPGTIFKINASGSFTTLHSFTGGNDGRIPGALVQGADGNFYGMTDEGGTNGSGTIFKINASGSFASLYSFPGSFWNPGALVQGADGNFYGTTGNGGTSYSGTIFKINASGTFTTLYSFTGGNDGSDPFAALVQSAAGDFYGTAYFGGTAGAGTIFKIDGSGSFTSLYSFAPSNDGAAPWAALVLG